MEKDRLLHLACRMRWVLVLWGFGTVGVWGQTTYYSKSTMTTFNVLEQWGTNMDGTGDAPTSISNANDFVVSNSATVASLGADVAVRNLTVNSGSTLTLTSTNTLTATVSGQGVITVNGILNVNGSVISQINAITLTITDGGVVSNNTTVGSGQPIVVTNFNINDGGTYNHNTGRSTNIGTSKTFGFNSNFVYGSGSGAAFSTTLPYGNLRVNTGGSATPNAASWTVNGNLRISSGTFNQQSANTGTLTIGGGLLVDGGSFVSSSGAGVGTLVFANAGLAIGDIQITSGSASFQNITVNSDRTLGVLNNISIPSSRTLLVNGALNCGANDISGSGAFTLSSGGTVLTSNSTGISGAITVSGTKTFDANANYEFQGASTGTFSTTANNVKINNAAGVLLSNGLTVNGTLTMTSGTLTLLGSTLTIGSSGSISGASASNYIVTNGSGKLKKNSVGASAFTFPIGDASYYTPVTLSNAETSDNFSVSFSQSYPACISTSGQQNGSVTGTWDVAEDTPGSSNCTISIDFGSVPAGSGFNIADARIAHCNGTTIDYLNGSGSGTTVTGSGFTSFSPFGVGTEAALPIELLYFEGKRAGTSALLTWATASEFNNDFFSIERSTDGRHFRECGRVPGLGTSLAEHSYRFLDEAPAPGLNFYRLRQVDYDGQFEYSKVISVLFEGSSSGLTLRPTLASEEVYLIFPEGDSRSEYCSITLHSATGQVLQSWRVVEPSGSFRIQTSQLRPGTYYLQVQLGRKIEKLRFVKQ